MSSSANELIVLLLLRSGQIEKLTFSQRSAHLIVDLFHIENVGQFSLSSAVQYLNQHLWLGTDKKANDQKPSFQVSSEF